MEKSFYVYGHFLSETDSVPFYIGKGKYRIKQTMFRRALDDYLMEVGATQ